MSDGQRRRSRFAPFLSGVLVGVLLAGFAGAGAVAVVLVKHPRLASRLNAELFPPPSQVVPVGDLTNVVVTVNVDAAGHPISPYIYGVAAADPTTLRLLGATINRWGGNSSTRYNWAIGHAWNAARDWEFRNGNYGRSGNYGDQFVGATLGAGAVPLITIPSIGYVARNDNNQTRSVGVPSHGGPALAAGSSAISGYDPASNQRVTSVRSLPTGAASISLMPAASSSTVYQDQWVYELVHRFGAAPSGVGFFTIDNEPDLWSVTHTDIHPVRMGYDDMLAMYEQYATAVKAQDGNAMLLGPDVSGWTAYFYSDLDRGSDNFATHADRNAHGGLPFLQWWLGQVARADKQRGSRSLDMLDVHFYPQGAGVFSGAHDAATQALRIRSVRALYDPTYRDESWIGTQVQLIPRLKQWIAQEYPGTGFAITEYNWGGEHDASGGVALAEVLGIYGRDGVDVATYWTYPPPNSPAGAAFRLYRNYDGHGATVGDVSIPVSVSQSGVVAFASRHSNSGEIDVVLVNEAPAKTAVAHLNLGSASRYTATQYQVAGGSSTIATSNVTLSQALQLPPYSLTLIKAVKA